MSRCGALQAYDNGCSKYNRIFGQPGHPFFQRANHSLLRLSITADCWIVSLFGRSRRDAVSSECGVKIILGVLQRSSIL